MRPTDSTDYTGEIDETHKPHVDGLGDEEIFKTLKSWYNADFEHSSEWRTQAKKDFDFLAGDQWDKSDKATLDDQQRPVITFNRCLPIIKAVCGLEINSRTETTFLPRNNEPGQVKANEILTAASDWMADGCDAEDEQSSAFQDAVICGMGWTDQGIEYDEEPDGKYVEPRIDPIEVVWDKTARAKNVQDARRVFRVKKMSFSEAKDMFPEADELDLDAAWAMGDEDSKDPKPVEERRLKLGSGEGPSGDEEVTIVHAQWWEPEEYTRTINPETGEIVEVDDAGYKRINEFYMETQGQAAPKQKAKRRVYKQCFLGGSILGEVSPGLLKDRFTLNCITGELKRSSGTWYGLIAVLRDPQMYANKWMSQTLHILNTTAKGGILAEDDAFKDMRDAQETYAQPDAITVVRKGAISNNKIMQKPGVGMPSGYINLLTYAVDSIPQVTGINMELMGLRDVNQPGVLEAQRKQSAMTILAPLMDSRKRFSKNVGRGRLDLIQRYFSDGRLVRIAGKDGVDELRALIQDETAGTYEVIVADAPTSPNSKQETWQIIQQIMPAMKEFLTPEAILAILDYSPLPSKLTSAFRDMMQKPPSPEEQEAKQIGKQQALGELAKTAAETAEKEANADTKRIKAMVDLITAGVRAEESQIRAVKEMVLSPEQQAEMLRSKAHEAERGRQHQRENDMIEHSRGIENREQDHILEMERSGPQLPTVPKMKKAGG